MGYQKAAFLVPAKVSSSVIHLAYSEDMVLVQDFLLTAEENPLAAGTLRSNFVQISGHQHDFITG